MSPGSWRRRGWKVGIVRLRVVVQTSDDGGTIANFDVIGRPIRRGAGRTERPYERRTDSNGIRVEHSIRGGVSVVISYADTKVKRPGISEMLRGYRFGSNFKCGRRWRKREPTNDFA